MFKHFLFLFLFLASALLNKSGVVANKKIKNYDPCDFSKKKALPCAHGQICRFSGIEFIKIYQICGNV